jgi:uncharacterized protein (DUF302 family)/uncharacterized membrane protein YidH (DUF202 family)
MTEPANIHQRGDLSDYLAAERTHLAWIRTGLALMGFGFVVARFGLFLQQMQASQHASLSRSYGLSLWFGTALITVGVLVNLYSGWQHARLVRDIDCDERTHPRPSMPAVAVALFLAFVGLAMAIYLVSIRSSENSRTRSIMEAPLATTTDNGIIHKPSNHSVNDTVERLESILQAKGVRLFALIDHGGEAENVGMKMHPTKLLIFGSPKAGTPLMLAAPSSAIDLPLKILVWEDTQGRVWVSYNSPDYLRERHGLPQDLLQNIQVVETLATKAGE